MPLARSRRHLQARIQMHPMQAPPAPASTSGTGSASRSTALATAVRCCNRWIAYAQMQLVLLKRHRSTKNARCAGSQNAAPGAQTTTRCAGTTLLALYPQQASSQQVAWGFCRAQHGQSSYLPVQGAALEAAQAIIQAAQVRVVGRAQRD